MKPIVSVCIPTYNGSQFLQECIESIISQTYSEFELLIVDDRSEDRTVEIAKSYAVKDSRITVVENPQNLGLVGNWNRCIELSHGEWIKFVFQDDKIEPNCLERMLEESTPDCDLVFCRRVFIFEADVSQEKQAEYARFVDFDKVLPNTTQITANEYCQTVIKQPEINIIGEPTSSMVRKRAFERFGNFNPNLIQICDLELWHRIATNMGITFLRENLAFFRVHNESTTAKNHNSRTYRVTLDFMLTIHDFAFHPAYQNLRSFCLDRTKIDLSELMIKEAYSAWQRGQYIAKMYPQESKNIESTWEIIIKQYPRLSQVKALNVFKKLQYNTPTRINALKRKISLKVGNLLRRLSLV
jgi:glycosyltransferase involved in cell wall biosynthesis